MAVLIKSKPIKDVKIFGNIKVGSLYVAFIEKCSQKTYDVVVGADVGLPGMYRGDERFFSKEVGLAAGFDKTDAKIIYNAIKKPEDFDTQVKNFLRHRCTKF